MNKKKNSERERTFSFELIPGCLKTACELAKHFSSYNQTTPISSSPTSYTLGVHPTPYLSLSKQKKKKNQRYEAVFLGKQVPETDIMRIELCFVCFWLTENKFLEESEVVELVVEPVQSLLLGSFLAWFWPQVSEENEWEWEAAENWREEATVENCTASIARVWISSFLHCLRVFVFVFYFYPLKSTEISLW